MSTLAEMIAPILLTKLVDEIHGRLRVPKGSISKRKLKILIERLINNNRGVTKVKTLWNYDCAIDINEFYVEPKLLIAQKRKSVSHLDDKDLDDNILIQGVAGQGKSIYLRKLCSNEARRGEYVPLFFELRKMKGGVFKNIISYLNFNGWDNILENDIGYNHVYSNVKFAFFLDGLDEVASSSIDKIISEIDELAGKFKKHRFIVSSRFNSGLEYSNNFKVMNIDNVDIGKNEHVPLILKLSDDQELAQHVIQEIHDSDSVVRGLLITPLYITLLFINFKSQRGMPAAITEFYDELFGVLLRRHDSIKLTFKRDRRENLNDTEFRKIFDLSCFASKSFGSTNEFKRSELIEAIGIAREHHRKEFDVDGYLEDVIKITSLIVREGSIYQFIHKSIQEFFSSSFICCSPESSKKEFYRICLSDQTKKWRQELFFLEIEDSYAYTRYFLMPLIEEFVGRKIEEFKGYIKSPTGVVSKGIYGDTVFILSVHKSNMEKSALSIKDKLIVNVCNNNIEKYIDLQEEFYVVSFEDVTKELCSFILRDEDKFKAIGGNYKKNISYYSFTYGGLMKYRSFKNLAKTIDSNIVSKLDEKVLVMDEFCNRMETLPIRN